MSEKDNQGPVKRFTSELDYIIFGVGFAITALAVVGFALREEQASAVMESINSFLWTELSWLYLLIMFIVVVFVAFLTIGPWGKIKLGREDEDPEFSYLAYFVMLYSAGTAAGVVFWGPAEAIFHYETPSPLVGAEPMSREAAVGAIQYSYFHWGLSAWSAYVVTAIPIAYFAYRYDAPMRISTIITPWVGIDRLNSFWAKIIDIIAVFATIGGVATTLGLVGSQFLVGLDYVAGVELGDEGTVILITGLTVAFTLSVATGIKKGIRRISYFNMGLFAVLTGVAFIAGPTMYILATGTEALGNYLNQFVTMSLYTNAGGDPGWVGNWTIFFWAWWFSWAPFVGLFIARISRGRTVRQVTITGVIASTGVTIPWYATMGGSAIFLQDTDRADILGVINQYGGEEAAAGYPLFEALPLGGLLTAMFLVLVTTFFITSADSSTLALGMLTTGGNETPSTINRVIWGGLIGLLASVLMVVGGVEALQAAAIITGGPFSIVLLIAIGSMALMFNKHHAILTNKEEDVPSIDEIPSNDD
ncbi:BCCT family transporter [Natronococcus occultus]|uniref:Choline/carnitine/betaine transport n=1 Tax=Natronococcus occultus SP4 TaxID=694430 RepID=L0K0Q0_9EURY|nr:BCCT family transporter [Natronococcus occultus]AGB38857.1 choline/carnitine/betaine transport [Natronococcus occultus SP4]